MPHWNISVEAKVEKVISIYKKDSKLECSNYRPISLLSKQYWCITEKLIHNRLMKFVPEQKILYLKQLTVGRIFPLSMPLLIVLKMHLTKANLCAGFLLSSRKHLIHFFYSSITHFKTKVLATFTRLYIYISFSVPGNQPAKICPKVN